MGSRNLSSAPAHTAEHIFARSLTQQLGKIQVQKVVFSPEGNTVYIKETSLDWDIVSEAEKTTNKIISEARRVVEHTFPSLDEAKMRFPTLRAHEERIEGLTRVIEVEDHDYCACAGTHVNRTDECTYFLVTRMAKAGVDMYEIDFEIGDKAKQKALEYVLLYRKISDTLGANFRTILQAAKNLKEENNSLHRRLAHITTQAVLTTKLKNIDNLEVFIEIFEDLEPKEFLRSIGRLTKEPRRIVALMNLGDAPLLVLSRSEDITLDCKLILPEVLKTCGGKGGGTSDFASGTCPRFSASDAFAALTRKVSQHLGFDLG